MMSDSDTSAYSNSDTENDFSGQEDVPEEESDSEWSDFDEEAIADVEDGSQIGMANEIDISKLVLCKTNKPGSMVPLSCTVCFFSRFWAKSEPLFGHLNNLD